jgi:hypothetical protein
MFVLLCASTVKIWHCRVVRVTPFFFHHKGPTVQFFWWGLIPLEYFIFLSNGKQIPYKCLFSREQNLAKISWNEMHLFMPQNFGNNNSGTSFFAHLTPSRRKRKLNTHQNNHLYGKIWFFFLDFNTDFCHCWKLELHKLFILYPCKTDYCF